MNDCSEILPTARRARWMSALAQAEAADLDRCPAAAPADHTWLRAPETGLIMVRGRAEGSGAPFNLGEMSVTRCALRLADGTVGMAYVRGRDHRHAERAALADARLQRAERLGELEAALRDWIVPLEARRSERAAARAAKVAASRVEFFTVVRGEDQP